MSQQELNQDDLTPQEVFEQAVNETGDLMMDAPEVEEQEQEEFALDHQPTDEDSDDYWRKFAESKGWKDSTEIDPANFKGFKAFVRDYDRIQENKLSQSELKEQKRQQAEILKHQREIMNNIQAENEAKIKRLKEELEAEKQRAKDNFDFEAYDAANSKLNEVEASSKTATSQPEVDPKVEQVQSLYSSFIESNPEIKEGSESYDPILHSIVQTSVNKKVEAFAAKYGMAPDVEDIQAYLNEAVSVGKSSLAKYQKPAQPKPPATNSANSRVSSKAKPDVNKLKPDERRFYDYYKNRGEDAIAEDFLKQCFED